MPRYVVGCREGHDVEVDVPFSEFDQFKENVAVLFCMNRDGTDPVNFCQRSIYIKPQATPFSFWRGDADIAHSIKKFGMGNLGEI